MRRTRFVNAQTLELATTVNDTNTSIVLTDATSLPAEGDYNLTIGDEIVLATHRTANTLTVVRGEDGTAGASHTAGAEVQVIATKTAMDKVMCDAGLLCAANPTNLTANAADFSWTNQGTSTLTDTTWGGLALAASPAVATHSLRIVDMAAPSEPWTFTGKFLLPSSSEEGISGSHAGLIISDSGSSKHESVSFRRNRSGGSGGTNGWWRWNTNTSYGATISYWDWQFNPTGFWARWVNDGTDIQPFSSCDGENWLALAAARPKGQWLTTNGPDRIGFYFSNHQTDGEILTLEAWSLT